MKKFLRRIFLLLLLVILAGIVLYVWPRVPIITSFAAKGMCSSVFVAGKDPERVLAEDLSFFPISLASCEVDYQEKAVTARVWGMAGRKAVFREGLGAVIVLDTPEEELRSMAFRIPDPGYRQDTMAWPKGDLLHDDQPAGLRYEQLEEIVEAAFDPPGAAPSKKTLAVVVVYDGNLVAEKYLDGYDMHTPFHAWSMTKSVGSAMAGILSSRGVLDLDAPIDAGEWKQDSRTDITPKHLLHMNSGLEWLENYFTISEATIMLMRSDDMVQYISSVPSEYPPGTHYSYSSGDANLLSGAMRIAMADDEAYHTFPYCRLFHRIGMLNTLIEADGSGTFVTSSYAYGSARDWARFGLLYLNDGVFEGDTILPAGWVDFTRQPAPNSGGKYAASFWLREPNPLQALKDVPDDVYFADGFLGQRTYIIPSEKLVVVRMGYSLKNFNLNDFLSGIISTLPS